MTCEKCKQEFQEIYGSGRFCSSKCARSFSTKSQRNIINEKVSNSMKGRKTGRCTFTKEQRLRGMLNNKIKAEERMKNTPWPELHRKKYKERILHEQNYKCAICQMDPIWNGKPLKFQLDHINGRINNNRENLRVVCPNCHSQTDNFCRTATKEGKNKLREVALKNFRKSTWKT